MNLITLARIVRLPAVFSAISNLLMGFLLGSGGDWSGVALWIPALVTCVCLYWAGMVLNDVHDFDVDRKWRPERVLPSGKMSLAAAKNLGSCLLALGVVAGLVTALLAAALSGQPLQSVPIALSVCLLAAAIRAYDSPLKSSWMGPPLMGTCRSLNVFFGMLCGTLFARLAGADPTIVPAAPGLDPLPWESIGVPAGIGIYVMGLTLFAREESRDTIQRRGLVGGAVLMGLGLAVVAWGTLAIGELWASALSRQTPGIWMPMACLLVMFPLVRRTGIAIATTDSSDVQRAVALALKSLIIIDAVILLFGLGSSGIPSSLILLSLLIPSVLAGRWIRST